MNDAIVWILLGLAWLAAFIFFEVRALRDPKNPKRMTLSRFVFTVGAKFPLSIFLMGMVVGGLAVHFFWHWCPPGSISGG